MRKSKVSSKYTVEPVGEFQSGSRKRVLKNKLGITSVSEMHDKEILAYRQAAISFAKSLSSNHKFTVSDLKHIHEAIFGELYDWAGKYRDVEVSKDGFLFARAIFVDQLMREFSANVLEKVTPAKTSHRKRLTLALAEIHVEFIVIHPFREGNGRTIRLVLNLIAQQAGYEGLDFGFIDERGAEYDNYIRAIHAGVRKHFGAMATIMDRALVGSPS